MKKMKTESEEREILQTIYDENDKVKSMRIRKIVKKISRSGHILVPKSLIGKEVLIIYESTKNNK
jgi:putative transposon-encoded protein